MTDRPAFDANPTLSDAANGAAHGVYMGGFQAIHRDGLRACDDGHDRLALLWLCERADVVGWGNAFDCRNTTLSSVAMKGRGWVRGFLRRMVESGVLVVVDRGSKQRPRRVMMPSPLANRGVIHERDHERDHKSRRATPKNRASDSPTGPPTEPVYTETETETDLLSGDPTGGDPTWVEFRGLVAWASSPAVPAGKRWRPLTEADGKWWAKKLSEHPSLDLVGELRSVRDWLEGQYSAPGGGNGWTARGWKAGLGRWLKSSQGRRGSGGRLALRSAPAPAAKGPCPYMWVEAHSNADRYPVEEYRRLAEEQGIDLAAVDAGLAAAGFRYRTALGRINIADRPYRRREFLAAYNAAVGR